MRKEQVLLLALLAALFGPASSQDYFEDDDISDECIVKTSIVLKKLSTCDSQKIQDDFKRNQLWTDVVKETIEEMIKQLRAEIKSQSDEVTNKLENKVEAAMKQARDDKLEMKSSMDRNLQSVEANKKQMDDLLQGHDKVKSTMDRILQSDETKKKQMDDLLQGHDEMKSTMDRTLQSVEENKKQIDDGMKQVYDDKLEMKSSMDRTLQSVEVNKKQMEDLMKQGQSIKDCQRTLAAWSLIEKSETLFKAMGRTFYYNWIQSVTWYENRDWCSSRGMHLATLKTADELNQVANALRDEIGDKNFWVSASDIGRWPGQFQWSDGTPVLNSIWASSEPNSHTANQQTCTYIFTGNEKLYDHPCSETALTLCEVPELLATCL